MATLLTNYQCPACTGPLHFSAESGKPECEYCGTVYEIEELESLYEHKEEQAAEAFETEQPPADESEWDTNGETWEEDGMKAYNCPSCGAALVCEETTAATSCPYCGNPTVVPGQFAGLRKPDLIIPFAQTKDAAIAALKQHCKGKFLLPKSFRDENHIAEIKGVYVPFWLFDCDADADIAYACTRSYTRRSGDNMITTVKHYDVRRSGSMSFERVPVDASSKMPDGHMAASEPFDYTQFKPFSSAYLPGFLADIYDVEAADCAPRAEARCADAIAASLRDTVIGYTSCTERHRNVRLQRGKAHYALLPVWMLFTKWRDKDYLFAMNGQTGRMVGDLPVSWGKFWGLFAALSAVLSLIGVLIAALS